MASAITGRRIGSTGRRSGNQRFRIDFQILALTLSLLDILHESTFKVVLRSAYATPEGTLDDVAIQQRVVVVVLNGVVEGAVWSTEFLTRLFFHIG